MTDPRDYDTDPAELDDEDEYDPADRDGSSEPLGAEVVNWRELTPSEAPAVWAALRDWVEWLTARYNVPVTLIPDCWWRHGGLVEELSALHTAWVAAYDTVDAGYGPIGWLERFQTATERWRTGTHYTGSCSAGHVASPTRTMRDKTDEQAWNAWVRATHAEQVRSE